MNKNDIENEIYYDGKLFKKDIEQIDFPTNLKNTYAKITEKGRKVDFFCDSLIKRIIILFRKRAS